MPSTEILKEFRPGSLVRVQERDWVVLPSADKDLLLLKPLDGADTEITGIFLPLSFAADAVTSATFQAPGVADLGAFSSARILYNAARLSLRNASGPFRAMGKLSFRPRAYQMVPLIMALRQKYPIRLLIADDVGVGKTIEALIILKELLERKEIERFAIIVLPHLCEQWQEELRDKFGIEAVIIRSNTQARLDRDIPGDIGVFQYYPYQVISIDYIKSDQKRMTFIQNCPQLVIVDEAHTCTASNSDNWAHQQRHKLLEDIFNHHPNHHLILLTATPHSGKPEQFNSLLGLLKKEFKHLDLTHATDAQKHNLAHYFVQRRRKEVEKWSHQDTPFPHRDAGEFQYNLAPQYADFYYQARTFVLGLTQSTENHSDSPLAQCKIRYWAALGLLRGIMSSPAAGIEMLHHRQAKITATTDNPECIQRPPTLFDEGYNSQDYIPTGLIEQIPFSNSEAHRLQKLITAMSHLFHLDVDTKAQKTILIIKEWLSQQFNPIIFCRFIATANYLGEILKKELAHLAFFVDVQVVTSEDPDELRKSRIEGMKPSVQRVLVATDCLSEGINLQHLFNAILHYDLPWNPNRLEQREGRIDRFGQNAPIVKTYLLYSPDNPMDKIVLGVLLRKVRQIRSDIGISIPFPEDNLSFMDAVLQEVISQTTTLANSKQRSFNFENFPYLQEKKLVASREIEAAAEREKISSSIFAKISIKPEEIEQDLTLTDKTIGTPEDVEAFFKQAMPLLGVQLSKDKQPQGYTLYTTNLPHSLKAILPAGVNTVKISFYSPTPEGYLYIGRNHPLVENLCRLLLSRALLRDDMRRPARAAVITCKGLQQKTTLLLLRVRNIIAEKSSNNQLIAEEMLLWGYQGSGSQPIPLSEEQLALSMNSAISAGNLSLELQTHFLNQELQDIVGLKHLLDVLARERAQELVSAHQRFHKLAGGQSYKIVEPVLPMDFIGIYILLPDHRGNQKET